MNTHLHLGAWIIAFILLFAVVLLHKQGNARAAKIVQMILRLFYIVILISGIILLWGYFHGSKYLVVALIKSFMGIWLIGAMEMVSIRTAKEQATKSAWIQLIIAFVITLVLGFQVLS